jgi:hypothetical protein
MKFESVLVANVGVSGEIAKKRPYAKEKIEKLAMKIC